MIQRNFISNLKNISDYHLPAILAETDLFIFNKQKNDRANRVFLIAKEIQNRLDSENIAYTETVFIPDSEEEKIISFLTGAITKSVCHIVIDISCMAGDRTASIFHLIAKHSEDCSMRVRVLYSLAKYIPPSKTMSPNETVAPAHPRFAGWLSKPHLPILAIVGLGYETDKALGAVEYLDAEEKFIFIPDSAEMEYRTKVEEENRDLLQMTVKERIFEYCVEDPTSTIQMLNSLTIAAKTEFKPTLLPFGPKIFFAASLVVALAHPEASVWYVSGEKNDALHNEQEVATTFGFEFELTSIIEQK